MVKEKQQQDTERERVEQEKILTESDGQTMIGWRGVIGPEDDDILVAEATNGRGLLTNSDVIGNPASDTSIWPGDSILRINSDAFIMDDDQPTEPVTPIISNPPLVLKRR